jgi:hypothetical protein
MTVGKMNMGPWRMVDVSLLQLDGGTRLGYVVLF